MRLPLLFIVWLLILSWSAYIIHGVVFRTHLHKFNGYASVFGNRNANGSMTVKGAFTDSIAWHKAFAAKYGNHDTDILVFWGHDYKQPIGRLTEIYEDEYGLYISGIIDTDVPLGAEIWAMMQENIVDSVSIGFNPILYSKIGCEEADIAKLPRCKGSAPDIMYEVDLIEVSIVSLPADRYAKIKPLR